MRGTTAERLSANLVDAPISGWICLDWAGWTALLRSKGNGGAGGGALVRVLSSFRSAQLGK